MGSWATIFGMSHGISAAHGLTFIWYSHGTSPVYTSTGSKHNTLFHPSLQPIYCTSNTWNTPAIERHKAHCAEHQTQRIDSMILQSTELILNSRQLMTRLPHQLSMRVDPKDTPHIILQYLAVHMRNGYHVGIESIPSLLPYKVPRLMKHTMFTPRSAGTFRAGEALQTGY